MTDSRTDLVEMTAAQSGELQNRHFRKAGPIQRSVRRSASFLGRSGSIAFLLFAIGGWIAGNLPASADAVRPIEQAPFSNTALIVTVAAFLISLLILSAQRFDEELAD